MSSEQEQRWMDAWRRAGPELQRLRDEELRRLDETAGLELLGAALGRTRETSGLITLQAWLMRQRVLDLLQQIEQR